MFIGVGVVVVTLLRSLLPLKGCHPMFLVQCCVIVLPSPARGVVHVSDKRQGGVHALSARAARHQLHSTAQRRAGRGVY